MCACVRVFVCACVRVDMQTTLEGEEETRGEELHTLISAECARDRSKKKLQGARLFEYKYMYKYVV